MKNETANGSINGDITVEPHWDLTRTDYVTRKAQKAAYDHTIACTGTRCPCSK